jgi:predicted negative regulator of RcsB-dependent stress response
VVTAEARDEADKKLPDLQGRLPAQPQEVLDEVRASLALYSADALPDALLLVARAQVALAQEASDAYRKMLLEDAALEAMKVYVNYAPSPKAGQSLLLAGDAMAALGNQQAARKAYEKVVKEFKQSDSAAAAQAALDKMIAK